MTEIQPEKQEMTSIKPTRKYARCAIWISASLLFLLCLLLASIGIFFASEQVQQRVIQWADSALDELSIQQVTGNLQQGLQLEQVHWQSAGVDVQLAKGRLQLDYSCFWQANFCVEDLSLNQANIAINSAELPKTQTEDSSSSPRPLNLPLDIMVKKVQLGDIQFQFDQHHLHLANLTTAAQLQKQTGLTLQPTLIEGLQLVQSTQTTHSVTTTPSAEPAQHQETENWATAVETFLNQPLLANFKNLPLPFAIHIQDLQGKHWQYQQQGINPDTHSFAQIQLPFWQLQADIEPYQVQLQQLNVQSSLGNLQGQGQLNLTQDFPINFQLATEINDIRVQKQLILPKSRLALQLTGNLLQTSKIQLNTAGAVEGNLTANVQLNQPKIPLDLHLQMRKGQYPFYTAPSWQLLWKDVEALIQGNVLDYVIDLKGNLTGIGIPQTDLYLQAQGGISGLQIQDLQINTLQGQGTLAGEIGWRDGFNWRATLKAKNLNLQPYIPQTQLSGQLQSSGFVNSQSWQVDVQNIDLQGKKQDKPIIAKGNLQLGSQYWLQTENLLLQYANNIVEAKGQLSEQSHFSLNINAPNLAGLVPDLKASLQGDIQLEGDIWQPNLQFDLTGNQIQYQQLALQKLFVKGRLQNQSGLTGRIDFNLDNFRYADFNLKQGKLWLTGNEGKHQLHLNLQGEPLSATLHLYGKLDKVKQQWQGILNQTEIRSPWLNLKNGQNIQLEYQLAEQASYISAHCWQSPDLELCFPQRFKAGVEGEIPFTLKKLNLALINKWLQQETFKGGVQAQGQVAWFKDKPMAANLQLKAQQLAVEQKVNQRTFKLSLPSLNLNGELANNNLSLKSALKIEKNADLSLDLNLQDIAKSRALSGNLTLQNVNLNLLNQLLAQDDKVEGALQAQLKFAGNLTAPLLQGDLTLNHLQAKLKALPFQLNDGGITLKFLGNRSNLNGYLQSLDSRLNLTGEANWQNLERWTARLHVQADQFKLDIPNMAKIKVSPDVELKATANELELQGTVDIPWARIEVDELPESAVELSSDTVILQENGLPKKLTTKLPQQGMRIRSSLKINIGDDVTLKAYGLKTHLNGLLTVRQDKEGLGLFGQVNLKQGRYAAYGQDLLVRKGEISFSGLPSQPFLNIEAIRNPDTMENNNVSAGIKVIGAASAPELSIFSEPSMSQDQALSYLLTGRSLENSGSAGSGASLGSALIGLSLGKGGKLVGGLGEAFGISNLNLDTQGIGDGSQVVVSGNITPKLQIKYGVGLFQSLAELTVRYRLLPRLYLQSVSGANQALDLLYQFEF